MNVTLLGYYGFDNLGDELLLEALLAELAKQPDCQPVVLSASPPATTNRYGVPASHRFRLPDMVRTLWGSRWLILGGGGLFQDSTSLASVVYYTGMVVLARLLGNRVLWWAQGVGPLRRPAARWLTGLALRLSHVISVRDEASARLVRQLSGKTATLVGDPVWLLPPLGTEAYVSQQDKSCRVGISLRPWLTLTDVSLDGLARMLNGLSTDTVFVLLPFQPEDDRPVLAELAARLPADRVVWSKDIRRDLPGLSAVIGMRFHAMVLAVLAGVPVWPIAYDPKVSALAEHLSLPYLVIEQLADLQSGDWGNWWSAYPLYKGFHDVLSAQATADVLHRIKY